MNSQSPFPSTKEAKPVLLHFLRSCKQLYNLCHSNNKCFYLQHIFSIRSNQQQQKNTTECCDRGYWEFILDHVEDLKGLISKFCKWILRKIESEWPEESGTTFFFWICSIVVDPFVLYVPRIDDNDKSLNFDRSFLGIISGLYIIISCLKIIIYLYNHQNIRLQPILWRIFVFGVPSVPILATVSSSTIHYYLLMFCF